MYELHSLDNSQLMDLLATHTSEYTKMITDNNMGDEYEKVKQNIKALTHAIESNRSSGSAKPDKRYESPDPSS